MSLVAARGAARRRAPAGAAAPRARPRRGARRSGAAAAPGGAAGAGGGEDEEPHIGHPEAERHHQLEEVTVDELAAAAADGPVVVDWEAKWCRKCKYLRPKLVKLANTMPALRFVSVDVNAAPFSAVQEAGVSKMPTIQVWRNGKKVGEVVGSDQAPVVLEKVNAMIHETTELQERHDVDVAQLRADLRSG